jgi:hypothetical protein
MVVSSAVVSSVIFVVTSVSSEGSVDSKGFKVSLLEQETNDSMTAKVSRKIKTFSWHTPL